MEITFAVDKSLGTLAKWLRMLGYDTIYEPDVSSIEFYARREDPRILITRNKKIPRAWEGPHHIFITSNFLVEQLKQVVAQIGIKHKDIRPFTRCIRCNLPICAVDKRDVHGRVPDFVWETNDAFSRCSRCNRIYWPGSHTERSMDMIKLIFDDTQAAANDF